MLPGRYPGISRVGQGLMVPSRGSSLLVRLGQAGPPSEVFKPEGTYGMWLSPDFDREWVDCCYILLSLWCVWGCYQGCRSAVILWRKKQIGLMLLDSAEANDTSDSKN